MCGTFSCRMWLFEVILSHLVWLGITLVNIGVVGNWRTGAFHLDLRTIFIIYALKISTLISIFYFIPISNVLVKTELPKVDGM